MIIASGCKVRTSEPGAGMSKTIAIVGTIAFGCAVIGATALYFHKDQTATGQASASSQVAIGEPEKRAAEPVATAQAIATVEATKLPTPIEHAVPKVVPQVAASGGIKTNSAAVLTEPERPQVNWDQTASVDLVQPRAVQPHSSSSLPTVPATQVVTAQPVTAPAPVATPVPPAAPALTKSAPETLVVTAPRKVQIANIDVETLSRGNSLTIQLPRRR
jgi:hypothetical protein